MSNFQLGSGWQNSVSLLYSSAVLTPKKGNFAIYVVSVLQLAQLRPSFV